MELHEKAISLAASDEERMDGYEEVGRDHESAFHGDEAFAAYAEAIAVARRLPDRTERLVVLLRRAGSIVAMRGGSFRGQPDMEAVDRLIEEGLAVATSPRERAALLLAKGAMFVRRAFPADVDVRPIEERLAAVREAAVIAEDLDPSLQFSIVDTLTEATAGEPIPDPGPLGRLPDVLANGVSYTLGPWRDGHTMRAPSTYDAATEKRRAAELRDVAVRKKGRRAATPHRPLGRPVRPARSRPALRAVGEVVVRR